MRSKLILASCLLLSCCLPQSARCQSVNGIYRGTLGKQEIVLEIGAGPEQANGQHLVGRYFYRRHGIAIYLKGAQAPDGSFLLDEYDGNEKSGNQWKLKFQGRAASGNFCKCDLGNADLARAKLLPIEIKQVSTGFSPDFITRIGEENNAPPADQAYYDLLLDSPLTTGTDVMTKSGYAYAMVEDPRFKTALPRITRFPDAAAIVKINKLLEKELTKFRLEAADCLQSSALGGGQFDIAPRVELFSRHLLSVVREGESYCGGAHPNTDLYVNTYDLDSGAETSVEKLLAREMDPEAVRKLTKSGGTTGKEGVTNLMGELYLKHYKADDESCREVINRNEDTHAPDFTTMQYLSDNGLVIVPDVPHVAQSCAEPLTVSYEELRPLLKKNSPFLTLVRSAP